MNTKKILADLIERMRKHSNSAIAIKAGLTRQTVSNIEQGKNTNPTLETVQSISDAIDFIEC